MADITLSDEEQLQLQNLGVEAVILFGSQAQDLTHPGSDYDIAVIQTPKSDTDKIYDNLYSLLSEKINKLVNIDIVFMSKSPMELQSHVAKFGQVIFQITPNVFADFKQQTMLSYSDFAPLRRVFQHATLSRI